MRAIRAARAIASTHALTDSQLTLYCGMVQKALHARLHGAPFLDVVEAEKKIPFSRITQPEFDLAQLVIPSNSLFDSCQHLWGQQYWL